MFIRVTLLGAESDNAEILLYDLDNKIGVLRQQISNNKGKTYRLHDPHFPTIPAFHHGPLTQSEQCSPL